MNKQHDLALMKEGENLVIFYPHVPETAIEEVEKTLKSRWIGQGPKVNLFEHEFTKKFCPGFHSVAVNSGTSALHLAYLLAGVGPGDEVIVPVFTCTATTIPLLWIGAIPVMADISSKDLNIDPGSVKKLITKKTKAIVCVHYGGLPCDMDELKKVAGNIPIIEDAAQAIGAKYKGKYIGEISDYTCFSFQATKHITTGDGGMLVLRDKEKAKKAKRLRWFGIDREKKQKGIWENDIKEVGYKYQMTDIAACMGLAGLNDIEGTLIFRSLLRFVYAKNLSVEMITGGKDKYDSSWLCTILVDRRKDLQKKLKDNHIESGTIHCRNDIYSIFGGRKKFPNMDAIEDKYLVLPLHNHLQINDVKRICNVINSGW